MENNNNYNKNQQKGCSSCSSSITTQLFGPPQSDILASIFPPKKEEKSWQKESSSSRKQSLSNKQGNAVNNIDRSSIYHQEGAEPSYLSSSLYYGGQETYSGTSTHRPPSTYPSYTKDGDRDDRNDAPSANWWQGSLYY